MVQVTDLCSELTAFKNLQLEKAKVPKIRNPEYRICRLANLIMNTLGDYLYKCSGREM